MDFETLDLTITGENWSEEVGGRAWLSVAGHHGATHRIPRDITRELLEAKTRYAASIGRAEGADIGTTISRDLRGLVFGVPEVESIFTRTRGAAASSRRSPLVRVLPTPGPVAAIPWELLADPHGGAHTYLTMAPDVVLARSPRVRTRVVRDLPLPLPLRVLIIASNPPLAEADLQFDAYEHRRAVLDRLAPLRESGHVEVTLADPPTIECIRGKVAESRHGFHVVHYVGHATTTSLILEEHDGRPKYVDASAFIGLLQECADLRLVVLAGCETSMHGDPTTEHPDRPLQQLSIAESCVRDVSPCVIGMQTRLPFSTESVFVACLYQALAAGRSVGEALRLARAAVRDDRHTGYPRLDFSVPTIMVAGASAGPLVDSDTPATPRLIRRARPLRQRLYERDPSLLARPTHLRKLVDFFAGRTEHRLVTVSGPPRVGKTDLVARALREVEESVEYILYCRYTDLEDGRPGRNFGRSQMADWIRELLATPANQSWGLVLEQLVDARFVVVIDDADELRVAERSTIVGRELHELLGRHGQHRVALVQGPEAEAPQSPRFSALHLAVPELPPADVRRWVTRQLPALPVGDDERFTELTRRLGSDLALWRDLARLHGEKPDDDIVAVADALISSRATRPLAPAPSTPAKEPVRVAVAGDLLASRHEQLATAITKLASAYGVAARFDTSGSPTPVQPFGVLLHIPSPFAGGGTAGDFDTALWMQKAIEENADIILADFGSEEEIERLGRTVDAVAALDTLVIAAGGNHAGPVWPAWYPSVLAVGSLDPSGEIAPSGKYDPEHDKPDLFAPGYSAGTDLDGVPAWEGHGSSYAASQVLLAAIVVMAAGNNLSPDGVRDLLVSSAAPLGDSGARRLDLSAAMQQLQSGAVTESLRLAPGDLVELAARTGLAGQRTQELVDHLVTAGTVTATDGIVQLAT